MSLRRRPIPSTLAATAAAALLFSGCSSSSGAAAPSVGTSTLSTSSVQAAGSSAPTTTGDVSTSESTAGSQVDADPVACASLAQKWGAVTIAILPILQGTTGPTPFDADKLSAALSAKTMGVLPVELDPDFAALTTAAGKLKGKDLTAAAAAFDGPELTKATGDIDKYLSDHC